MYRNLLVPLDGSAFGEQSLPLALQIAQRADATLHLVHVHLPVSGVYSIQDLASDLTLDARLREREAAYLKNVAGRLARIAPVRTQLALLDGLVVDALQEQATTIGADLVVMTTHGRGPLSRLWLGSIADKVMRRLPMPVLLVRPQEEAPQLHDSPALQRILIPLDGSVLAEQILEPTLELGNLTQAEYVLLRVLEPMFIADSQFGDIALGGLDPGLPQELQKEAETYLERVAKRLQPHVRAVQTRLVVNRPAALAIVEEAQALAVHLIALATHGYGGLTRLVLGSVADKVLRAATVPVLLRHPPVS
jgi:nucleotide-binding universal stress UspA family protein